MGRVLRLPTAPRYFNHTISTPFMAVMLAGLLVPDRPGPPLWHLWQRSVARERVRFIYFQPSMPNSLSVAGWNSKYKERGADPAGFWGGLWHGAIAPITFIVSLFIDGVSIYETNNNGRWYELGFMLGIGAYAGSEGVRSVVR